MLKIIFITFKVTAIAVLILVLGQITVGEKSISNHVHDLVSHPRVQAPIRWIAMRIDHTAGHVPVIDEENIANTQSKKNTSSQRHRANSSSANGQERLSGLLKRSED